MRKTVAVVGCGIGRSHIVEGYVPNADRFEVLALCDLDEARLALVGDEFGVPRRTTRFSDLLAMDDLDVIDICTPPGVHHEQIVLALRAGKHVVCEKPLVGSLAAADEIAALAAEAPGVLMPIFQYRYGDGIAPVKAVIDAGIAGKAYAGTVETLWLRGADYYAVPWRGRWATELGGVLVTHAIHNHDIATWLMGPVARLSANVATRVNAIEAEDCASVSCVLESGALLTLTACLGSQTEISRIRLMFENVTFESDTEPYQPGTRPWTIIPANEEVAARIAAVVDAVPPQPPRFTTQMALFHGALAAGRPPPVTVADARRALELVTAIYHAAETRAEVRLPIGPDHMRYGSWVPAGA